MRGIMRIRPIDTASCNDFDRQRLRLHRTNLHGAGLRAQQALHSTLLAHIKIVDRIARGMTLRNIECGEVVPLIFNLRSFRKREAHATKDLGDFINGAAQHMATTLRQRNTWLRDIHDRTARPRRCIDRRTSFLIGGLKRGLQLIEPLTGSRLQVLRHILERHHHGLQAPTAANPSALPRIKCIRGH